MRVALLDASARLPTRAYEGDAALDLYAAHTASLEPGARVSIGTGIALEIPEGHGGLVLPRSGLAARHGIALVNSPGLIDPGFRGEIRVLLLNTDQRATFTVHLGERIAQLLVVALAAVSLEVVSSLTESERGERGFGSSG